MSSVWAAGTVQPSAITGIVHQAQAEAKSGPTQEFHMCGGKRLMEKFGFATGQKYDVYASRMVTKEERFHLRAPGLSGCGEALAVRWVMQGPGRERDHRQRHRLHGDRQRPVIPKPPGWCRGSTSLFENTAAVASGIEAA